MNGEKYRLYTCCARIELTIPGALTLKDRRAVVKSLMERLKSRFNLSVADLDAGEQGASHAAIGIAAVSNKMEHARQEIDKAAEFAAGDARAELMDIEITEF